ncbi:MAG: YbjQ family protein [Abditibacteriaceae bacterium]
MNHEMTTTTFSLQGHRVVRNLGVVRGITVRSRSVIGSFGASIQTIFGGNITLLSELCEHAREEAYNKMWQHATQMGANAVIGLRYDATELMPGVSEVLCYGTAVVVEVSPDPRSSVAQSNPAATK